MNFPKNELTHLYFLIFCWQFGSLISSWKIKINELLEV